MIATTACLQGRILSIKKISTTAVGFGMCVASLERHWSETPFLFQGFPLSNPTELEELKKLCRHVNITVPDEEI